MRWLVLVLQWVYPLILLLAAASRSSLPSLVYLLSFFLYVTWPPIRELISPKQQAFQPGKGAAAAAAAGGGGGEKHERKGSFAGWQPNPLLAAAAANAPTTPGQSRHGTLRFRPTKSGSPSFLLSSSTASMGGGGGGGGIARSGGGGRATGHSTPIRGGPGGGGGGAGGGGGGVTSPLRAVSCWGVHRSYFTTLTLISGLMVLAQLIVHALMWSGTWRPAGQSDGHVPSSLPPTEQPELIRILNALSLAPWAAVRNGFHSLVPDVAVWVFSVAASIIIRAGGPRSDVRWLAKHYFCSNDRDETQLALVLGTSLAAARGVVPPPPIEEGGVGGTAAPPPTSSFFTLLLHFFICFFLFFAAILQPSLLALPYLVVLMCILLMQVFWPPPLHLAQQRAASAEERRKAEAGLNFFQSVLYAQGSTAQQVMLGVLCAYLMLHLTLLHLFQFSLLLSHLDLDVWWMGTLGLFRVDISTADEVSIIQWSFLISLVGTLVMISLKRIRLLKAAEQEADGSSGQEMTAATAGGGGAFRIAPVPPATKRGHHRSASSAGGLHPDAASELFAQSATLAASPPVASMVPVGSPGLRSAGLRRPSAATPTTGEAEEKKESRLPTDNEGLLAVSPGRLHPATSSSSAQPSRSSSFLRTPTPSPSPTAPASTFSSLPRILTTGTFELKSFLIRSFRNQGLLLICLLEFVAVMLVHDLFNVLNVAFLLLAMSLAHEPKRRHILLGLLRVQILFLVLYSMVQYLWSVPFLIHSSPPSDRSAPGSRAQWVEVLGLMKRIDGFTAEEVSDGSYAFLYSLDSLLPAMLIALYLSVHRATAANLTIASLFAAAADGDTHLMQRYLDVAPDLIRGKDRLNRTVLHVAAANGHVASVRMLMQHVDINAQDKLGNTPLHYAYKYGYDTLIHLLLSSGPKPGQSSSSVARAAALSGAPPPQLINTELRNRSGLKPAQMKQRWWTKVMRKIRSVIHLVQSFFYAHASKLTLLLLFFVASQSVNFLHMLYFIFFLLFFSLERVARRLWNLLVAYCGLVFFALYAFSVFEPLYSWHTRDLNRHTSWIRYLGLFSVRDNTDTHDREPDQDDSLDLWWSKLLIYYGIYVLAVLQKMVYTRGTELGMIDEEEEQQQQQQKNEGDPHLTSLLRDRAPSYDGSSDQAALDEQIRLRASTKRSRSVEPLQKVLIALLTYLTLLTVSLLYVSLFHLGYLLIFLAALGVHQFSSHAGRVMSGFWFLCIVYTAGVLFAQYAFLLPEFREWLEEHFNWQRFSLRDIGFRAPSEDTPVAPGALLTNTAILRILMPPTACFVVCNFYLLLLWRTIKSQQIKQQRAEQIRTARLNRGERPLVHVQRATEDVGAPLPSPPTSSFNNIRSRLRNPRFSTLPAPRRSSSATGPVPFGADVPPASMAIDIPPQDGHEVAQPALPGNGTAASPSPSPSPAPATLKGFSLLTPDEWAALHTQFYALYLFSLRLLAHHTAHLLTLFVLLYVILIGPMSLMHLFYLLLLLVWLPLDGRSNKNSLWLPLTLYSTPLLLVKYMFQFPSISTSNPTLAWFGLREFNGKLWTNLVADIAILSLATLQRVAERNLREERERKKKKMEDMEAIARVVAADEDARSSPSSSPTSADEFKSSSDQAQPSTPTPRQQHRQREQALLNIEVERLRKQRRLLDTLEEEEEEEAPSSTAQGKRKGKPTKISTTEKQEAQKTEMKTGRNVVVELSPVSSPSPSEDTTCAPPSGPSVGAYLRAAFHEVWVHTLDVIACFFDAYGLEVFLLFLLLTSYARSNVLSLLYVVLYTGCWIQFGGRMVLVRSRVLYLSLLLLLACSIVWQYCRLLGMPPNWLDSHRYAWDHWDPVIQQWVLLGHFTSKDLMWDCWSFVFLAWCMPRWRKERAQMWEEGTLSMGGWPCSRGAGAAEDEVKSTVVSAASSAPSSGTSTPTRQYKQSLLSSEDRKQLVEEARNKMMGPMKGADGTTAASSSSSSSSGYVPPSLSSAQTPAQPPKPLSLEIEANTFHESTPRYSHSVLLLKGGAASPSSSSTTSLASNQPDLSHLWSSLKFYSVLVVDKLLFVVIFCLGTWHNNAFAVVYLLFSVWYLLQNYCFDLKPERFKQMWLSLRTWNYLILLCYMLYQIPWVPYLFLSDANLRWEMVLGLHKFVRPPPGSRFDEPAYWRVVTNPLGDRGALPQILIFLLIEAQLLIIESDMFRESVMRYYADIRRLSSVRRAASTERYKEWLIQRIKSILLFREKLEASFTYIFLEAAKLNVDYFQDEMVWPQAKPPGWDERVNNLLLEDSLKQHEYGKKQAERQQQQGEGDRETAAGALSHTATKFKGAPISTQFRPQSIADRLASPRSPLTSGGSTSHRGGNAGRAVDSEVGGGGNRSTSDLIRRVVSPDHNVRHAFEGAQVGPMQSLSPSSPSSSPAFTAMASPDSPARVGATGGKFSKEQRSDEEDLLKKGDAASTDKQSALSRLSHWLTRPLLPHIDPVFWNSYAEDPLTGEISVAHQAYLDHLHWGQAVWRFIWSNTQWICFGLYFINLLWNGNLLSMFIPFLILCYALFERPRVGRGFWLVCMVWSSMVVSAKFIFQLYIFCVAIDTSRVGATGVGQVDRIYILAPSPYCSSAGVSDGYSADWLLGLRKMDTHTYFSIILLDIICLLSIVLHRTTLLARGMWYSNEEEEMAKQEWRRRQLEEEEEEWEAAAHPPEEEKEKEKEKPALATSSSSSVTSPPTTPSIGPSDVRRAPRSNRGTLRRPLPRPFDSVEEEVMNRSMSTLSTASSTAADNEMAITLQLLQQEEQQAEEEARKAAQEGADKAAAAQGAQPTGNIFSTLRKHINHWWRLYMPLEIQFYYDDLVPRERFHHVNVHKPGKDFYIYIFFIELVCAIWILVCYDYMASTSLNTVATSLSTNLFSGNMVLTLFIQILILILDRVCYLFRSLTGKIIVQYATLIYWFMKIFFDWPRSSQTAFADSSYLQFFFVLKLAYFVLSGLQVYTGFPPLEAGGFQYLTRTPGMYRVYLYKVYRALPFVFELRTMLDWMCSLSSLDLWDTLKLEEIHGSLYVVQCDIIYRRHHERGTTRPLIEKLCSGVLLFLLLLLIIFGPLLLFSTANPVSQNNPVSSTSIRLSLSGAQGEYPLVSISSYVMNQVDDAYYVQLQNEELLRDSDKIDSVQRIQMAPYSDSIWDISPPSLSQLLMSLSDAHSDMSLKFQYTFTREAGPQANKEISNQVEVWLPQDTQIQLARILNQTLDLETRSFNSSNLETTEFDTQGDVTTREGMTWKDWWRHDQSPSSTAAASSPHPFPTRSPFAQVAPRTSIDGLMSHANNSVRIAHVVPQFLRLPATSEPIELMPARNRSDVLLTLDVAQGEQPGAPLIRWWFVNETDGTHQNSIEFITVSNRIFAGPLSDLSYSIVAVYTLILFTIGQFVRLAFGNQVTRIPVDDLPSASRLVQIVEGIYIARQKKQLAKEEILYRRLLKIYRTPSLLLMLTARVDSEEEKRRAKEKGDDKDGDGDGVGGSSGNERHTRRSSTAAEAARRALSPQRMRSPTRGGGEEPSSARNNKQGPAAGSRARSPPAH